MCYREFSTHYLTFTCDEHACVTENLALIILHSPVMDMHVLQRIEHSLSYIHLWWTCMCYRELSTHYLTFTCDEHACVTENLALIILHSPVMDMHVLQRIEHSLSYIHLWWTCMCYRELSTRYLTFTCDGHARVTENWALVILHSPVMDMHVLQRIEHSLSYIHLWWTCMCYRELSTHYLTFTCNEHARVTENWALVILHSPVMDMHVLQRI